MKINLWDSAFAHVPYSVPGRISKNIEWVRWQTEWDGITVVTDEQLILHAPFLSRMTVGWLLECREYAPQNYRAAEARLDTLDQLWTHGAYLLRTYPGKCRFVPFGGVWIRDENWGMHPKSRSLSHIFSGKRFLPGHELRHLIAERFQMDCFGHGTAWPVARKEEALIPYRFSFAIENSRAENYFTEKLLDCFATGTIPIYWGAPNIADFFDPAGIVQFDSIDQLPGILASLDYERHAAAAAANLALARDYALPEDWIYNHILMGLE